MYLHFLLWSFAFVALSLFGMCPSFPRSRSQGQREAKELERREQARRQLAIGISVLAWNASTSTSGRRLRATLKSAVKILRHKAHLRMFPRPGASI